MNHATLMRGIEADEAKLDEQRKRLEAICRDEELFERAGLTASIEKLHRQNQALNHALDECREYFENQFDIEDDGGPNKEMRLALMIDEAKAVR